MIFDKFNLSELTDESYRRISESGRKDAFAKSVVDALASAINRPEVEVKFYVKHTDELLAAVDAFIHTGESWIDKDRTRANTAKNLSVIEFKNGSCITLIKEGNEL